MNFAVGKIYQNASGQFHVLDVDTSTMKLKYLSGPQAGRVLSKRLVDMRQLATTEAIAPAPAAPESKPRSRAGGSATSAHRGRSASDRA